MSDTTPPVLNSPFQFESSYYVYISDPGISWAEAKAAAESMTYLGATGYLATVTSAAENSFLDGLVTTSYSSFSGAWLGGEVVGGVNGSGGSAYWEVGPLAGQLFSVGQSAVPGAYANWGGAEPNDSGVFSTVYMNVGAEGWGVLNGQWADAKYGLANGDGVITGDNMVGYFVEFTPDFGMNDNAPVITTAPTQTVDENTTFVAALTSTDVDAVGINPAQFSIAGGADADLFDVVDNNLVFKTAPDYETDPHSYEVEVSAFDGANTSAQMIAVSLTDVSDTRIVLNFDDLSAMPNYSIGIYDFAKLSTQYLSTFGVSFTSGSPFVAVVNLGSGHATSGANAVGGARHQKEF